MSGATPGLRHSLMVDPLGGLYPRSQKIIFSDPPASKTELYENYNTQFRTLAARTPRLKTAAFRLRYQVYCIENRFEDPAANPGRLECDAYDEHSVHSLLAHRESRTIVGTVRLVLPTWNGQPRPLPIQDVTGVGASGTTAPYPAERTAEVSRFSLAKSFRHLLAERSNIRTQDAERKVICHLPLGLIRGCVQMSAEYGITHWTCIMEPALLRLLGRLGLHFTPVGPMVDFHGRRQPCWAELDTLLRGVWRERPEVWEVITDRGRLWPSPQQWRTWMAPHDLAHHGFANNHSSFRSHTVLPTVGSRPSDADPCQGDRFPAPR